MVDVDARLGIITLFEKNPSVGVEIGGVLRFGLYGTIAHLLGSVQVATLQRKVVGIVIEHADVVRMVLQGLIIGLVGLFVSSLSMTGIAYDGVEVTHHLLGALFVDMQQGLLTDSFCIGLTIVVVVGDGKVEVELQLVGVALHACLTEGGYFCIILTLGCLRKKHEARSRIGGVDIEHLTEYRKRLLSHLLGNEVLGIEHRKRGVVRFVGHDSVEEVDDACAIT